MKVRYTGSYRGSPGVGHEPFDPGEVREVEDGVAAELVNGGWFEEVKDEKPEAPEDESAAAPAARRARHQTQDA